MSDDLTIEQLIDLASPLDSEQPSVDLNLVEVIDREPSKTDVNRSGGAPIGVSDERWPKFNGKHMFHAVTVDLSDCPSVSKVLGDCRAVSVFVSSFYDHDIFRETKDEVVLLKLSQEDIDLGVNENIKPECEDELPEPRTFQLRKVSVPSDVFSIFEADDIDEDSPLVKLAEGLTTPSKVAGYVGGNPMWLQDPGFDGPLVLQFCESLLEMNLADGGYLYVFEDRANLQG